MSSDEAIHDVLDFRTTYLQIDDRVSRFLKIQFVSDNLGYAFRRVEVFHDINQRVENIDRFDY
jgi:hypothetical protein